jgi:hypothetical protein
MGWQPGPGDGAGASPDRNPREPGSAPPTRDPRLAWFAVGNGLDALVPSGVLALAADQVSRAGRRCPGATDDELTGLLRAWAAVESWAAGAKLGVIAEMIRRDDFPRNGGGRHGDLPMSGRPHQGHLGRAAYRLCRGAGRGRRSRRGPRLGQRTRRQERGPKLRAGTIPTRRPHLGPRVRAPRQMRVAPRTSHRAAHAGSAIVAPLAVAGTTMTMTSRMTRPTGATTAAAAPAHAGRTTAILVPDRTCRREGGRSSHARQT